MPVSRRRFLGASLAAGAAWAAERWLFQRLETLTAAPAPAAQFVEEWIPTTCWIGKQDCGILARRINGRVVKLEGHPAHPRNRGTLCPKGVAQIMAVYDPNRVKAPLIRTNGKGVAGQWRQASWDEALSLVAQRIQEVRQANPKRVLWQKGRSKAPAFYDDAFTKALGCSRMGHGAYCSDAVYRANEYTLGPSGGFHPDFRHTRLVLAWGWNITGAGGNVLCWITWPQQLLEARERGARVVVIDPRLRGAGPFADQWLPIRPGTDMALALALAHVLVERGFVDEEYLKRYTNAPFLVGEDGYFLRADGQELVWDRRAGRAVPYERAQEPALDGEYAVAGQTARPAFELFRRHLQPYTPEWAAEVCGVPAEQIRGLAVELGKTAGIGSTLNVDGVSLPYRPVSVMAYHMAQQELGFQASRAIALVFMLLGAVGAVGGVQVSLGGWKVHDNFQKLDQLQLKEPPDNPVLAASKYFPINSGNLGVMARVMEEPQRYGVDPGVLPEVCILHMANPVLSFPPQDLAEQAFRKFKFVVVISPWLSETADLFADVILPAATMEKYEGPASATDQYLDGVALRVPIMEPLYQSRSEIDIYMDLCDKLGVLYGPGGYLDQLNHALKLKEPYQLPLDRRPTVREIFDRWARSEGVEEGVAFFEKHGVRIKGPIPPQKYYGYATDPPFGGVRHRLYGESLLRYQRQMQQMGADRVYWQDYTPFPTWRAPTMEGSPKEYDLYLISYKLVEFKQSRSTFIPLLAELAPEQALYINPRTARARGIADGDWVWVESHHALTGQTKRVKVRARYSQAIREDTVAMPHHYGVWVHPWGKGRGPSPSTLFFGGEGYVANTADQSYHVKVRVTRA